MTLSPRALLLLAWGCQVSAASAAGKARPSLFFFHSDDGARIASCYADPANSSLSDVVKTRHIDRLACEGVRFDSAFYRCPPCTPSRGAISTGSYFWRVGSTAILGGLREGLLSVLRATKDPRLDDAFDRPPYAEADISGTGARSKRGNPQTNDHQ